MRSLGSPIQSQPIYRPVMTRTSVISPVPHFAGDKQKAVSDSSAKSGLWNQLAQWATALLERLTQWFSALFETNSSTAPSQATASRTDTAKDTEPVSRVDPRLKADPYERNRVAYAIADEVFPKLVQLYQEKPTVYEDSMAIGWEHMAREAVNRSVQKHLNTRGTVRLSFLEGSGIGLGEYGPPNLKDGPQATRSNLGDISVNQPHSYTYNLSKDKDRQAAYAMLVHEIRHLVKAYALDQCCDDPKDEPKDDDPFKTSYDQYLMGGGRALTNIGTSVIDFLSEHNPNLPPLETGEHLLKKRKQESLQPYWPDFCRLWERTDYPMLSDMPDYKEKITEIFRDGDPKILKQYVDRSLIEELESYMTAIKRAPGLSTSQIQPSDFMNLGRALLLRDMLRYYYEVRHIPKDQQHPFAEVKPLKLIA